MTAPKKPAATKPRPTRAKPPGKASRSPATPPPAPPPSDAPRLPPRGAGRPRKPTAPRTENQAELAVALAAAERALDEAAAAAAKDPTVAAALRELEAEQRMASRWAAYLRSQGLHTSALKYAEQIPKLAGRVVALRERLSDDLLAELLARTHREDALGGKR